jgi:hypothetical protein
MENGLVEAVQGKAMEESSNITIPPIVAAQNLRANLSPMINAFLPIIH